MRRKAFVIHDPDADMEICETIACVQDAKYEVNLIVPKSFSPTPFTTYLCPECFRAYQLAVANPLNVNHDSALIEEIREELIA